LVLAGSAEFKNELQKSDLFDQRLLPIIIKTVDIAYGGENGFNQAIELASDALRNVKFIHERKIIGQFFEEVSKDTGRYVFGVKDTMEALEYGSVQVIIIFENLEHVRVTLKDVDNNVTVKVLKPEEANVKFKDSTGAEIEVIDKIPLTEWFMENYKRLGVNMEIITDKSSEGSQFTKGFGGIGGLLRYKMEMNNELDAEENAFNDEDFI